MIAKEVEVLESSWNNKVHAALWSYRCTPSSSTSFTPFRLVYGIEGILPIEYDIATWRTSTSKRRSLLRIDSWICLILMNVVI